MPDGTMVSTPAEGEAMSGDEKGARGLSKIQFPYFDLEEAINLARIMRDGGGNTAFSRDQLAAVLKQPSSSGAFSAKVNAAKMFGLIESAGAGKTRVTQLGFDIIDAERTKAARAEAFLQIPLYKRLYEEFRGKTLPVRPHGLERTLVDFGVAVKRGPNARWAFERSAKQAGFFDHGDDRLVAPVISETVQADSFATVAAPADAVSRLGTSDRSNRTQNLLIEGLFKELPEPHEKWTFAERVRWLRLAASVFDVLYLSDEKAAVADKTIVIEVKAVICRETQGARLPSSEGSDEKG